MRSSVAAAMPALLLLLVPCLLHGADARSFRITSHSSTSVFSFGGGDFADTGSSLRPSSSAPLIESRRDGEATVSRRTSGDGRVILDFAANDAYDLPSVPSYLELEDTSHNFSKGANFAVAGATALGGHVGSSVSSFLQHRPPTPLSSFGAQIGWFEQLRPSLCATPERCDECLGKSLFVAGFGWNDYLLLLAANKTVDETRTHARTVVKAIADGVERLVKLGAKRVVVPGILPMGCAPVILSLYASPGESGHDRYGCLVRFNDLARYHNELLADEVAGLQEKRKEDGVSISFGGVWIPGLRISPRFWTSQRRVKRELVMDNQS